MGRLSTSPAPHSLKRILDELSTGNESDRAERSNLLSRMVFAATRHVRQNVRRKLGIKTITEELLSEAVEKTKSRARKPTALPPGQPDPNAESSHA